MPCFRADRARAGRECFESAAAARVLGVASVENAASMTSLDSSGSGGAGSVGVRATSHAATPLPKRSAYARDPAPITSTGRLNATTATATQERPRAAIPFGEASALVTQQPYHAKGEAAFKRVPANSRGKCGRFRHTSDQ